MASHPLSLAHLLTCTGHYGNKYVIAYQPPSVVQYSEVQVATHSVTPYRKILDQRLITYIQLVIAVLQLSSKAVFAMFLFRRNARLPLAIMATCIKSSLCMYTATIFFAELQVR